MFGVKQLDRPNQVVFVQRNDLMQDYKKETIYNDFSHGEGRFQFRKDSMDLQEGQPFLEYNQSYFQQAAGI